MLTEISLSSDQEKATLSVVLLEGFRRVALVPRCGAAPVQRAILKRSYYIVYFLQEIDRSIVLAVLDGRRDPSEIRKVVERRRPIG